MFNVIFKNYDGTDYTVVTVADGELVTAPTVPVRVGYNFLGWFSDEELANPFNFLETPITEETVLYSKWLAGDLGDFIGLEVFTGSVFRIRKNSITKVYPAKYGLGQWKVMVVVTPGTSIRLLAVYDTFEEAEEEANKILQDSTVTAVEVTGSLIDGGSFTSEGPSEELDGGEFE